MRTASDDIRAYDEYCDNLNNPPREDEEAPTCFVCGAADSNDAGLCDDCQDSADRAARMNRAMEIAEGRGDYLRDCAKNSK